MCKKMKLNRKELRVLESSIYVFSAVLLENSVQETLDEKVFFYFLVVNI